VWAPGHQPSVAQASWPEADPALLEQDAVTAVVRIQGTVRTGSRSLRRSDADLEGAALADDHPDLRISDRRSTGRGVHYVIVRAAKLVNMVV